MINTYSFVYFMNIYVAENNSYKIATSGLVLMNNLYCNIYIIFNVYYINVDIIKIIRII